MKQPLRHFSKTLFISLKVSLNQKTHFPIQRIIGKDCILAKIFRICFSLAFSQDSISYVGGVTFGKDIGPQRTPRSTSSRLVSCVYSFLALILINSYCANLTAFLVKEKVDLPISGIDDPRVRFYNCDLFNRQYHDSLND